jgi:hypothetical protein
MSNLSLFDSSMKVLSNNHNLSNIQVRYVTSKNKLVSKKLPIYNDDTCKDVLLKLSSLHSITTYDHIFAWYRTDDGIIHPLGFLYPSIDLDFPYKHKTSLDENFITSEGYRILVIVDKSPLHTLIEEYPIKTLFYTTIHDYLEYLNLNYKQQITDDICMNQTKFPCKDLYNGKLVKYWPMLTQESIYNISNTDKTKLKVERDAVKQMLKQSEVVYSDFKLIIPDEFNLQLLSLSNKSEGNTVYLARLFSDIKLGDIPKVDSILPFTKITLDDYTTRYCKLLKDAIVISSINESNYITQELMNKWFKSQVTTLPSSSVRYIDEKNTVSFKLYKDSRYVTLLIYSNGLTKLLLNGNSLTITDAYIKSMIQLSNQFISELNKQKVFSDNSIEYINELYEQSMLYSTIQFIYPVKNYKPDILIKLIKNMNSFIRYNKHSGTKVVCSYKKVNNYGQSIASVISSLNKSKRGLTKEAIITELETLFNISNEEALEEYDNWESEPSSKFTKGDDEGNEVIIDLLGTNIQIDVIGTNNYHILGRIYHLLNFMMNYYENYISRKKDPSNLFIVDKEAIVLEDIETLELEQELVINEQIDAIMSERSEVDDSIESTLSERQNKEEAVQETIDSAGKTNSSVKSEPLELSKTDADDEPLQLSSAESSLAESSLAESDDFDMSRLDDSDSSGGGKYLKPILQSHKFKQTNKSKQKGGYNVSGYYLNRLKKYDPELFKIQKDIKIAKRYPKVCGSFIGRQPVAITKEMLDKYNSTDEGEGVAFSEALNVPNRDPNIYYICPKYWDIKDERPRDPAKLHDFEDVVIDNKMTTSQKKDTDNYVLVRDESGYWDEAGNDIERYRIKLIPATSSHPKYEMPCCNAPRKGANKYTKGWEVDVLIKQNGKYKWKAGTVVSSTKNTVTVRQGGAIKEYPIGDVRRHKSGKTLTNSFPLEIDTYGYINPIIKQLVKLPLEETNLGGLVRKGVYRGSGKGDHSLLESLSELLSDTNSSSEILIDHIVRDLKTLYKQNQSIVLSIASGDFINKFKMDIIEFPHNKSIQFLNTVKKKYKFVNTNIKRIQEGRKKYKKPILKPIELFIEILKKGSTSQRLLLNNEINIFSSIIQFEKYLKDENEYILDEYVIPILTTIAKYPSKTFGLPISGLSIVVFEGVQEDIIISPPLCGFPNLSNSLLLLYKERRNLYEPIFYRKYSKRDGKYIYNSFIHEVGETDDFYEDNEIFKDIHESIQKQIDIFINDKQVETHLLLLEDLKLIMQRYELPINSYVYDSYCKVVYVKTDKNVLIPVNPTGVQDYMKLEYFPTILKKDYPKYSDVLEILTIIDRDSNKHYLQNISLSVVNESKRSLKLVVKELILNSGAYIPIKDELYDEKIHTDDVSVTESYAVIDKNIGTHENNTDKRIDYLNRNNYMKGIQKLFFQKVYLMLRDKPKLLKQIHKIKYHPIMLQQHKSEYIYDIIDKEARKIIILEDREIEDYNLYEKDHKLVIKQIEDMDSVLNPELVYYKLLKLMIECLLNYSERDYERFLQLDINLSKLKSLLNPNELLFSHKDIMNDYHLEYFVRSSRYIRNFISYGEPIQQSKLLQIHRLKDRTRKDVQGEFTKQYPQILHRLFGRKINLLSYKNEYYSESQVIHRILDELYEDDEITEELIQSLIQSKKLNQDSLDRLTEKFKNIGIYCISKLQTKRLQHDIMISYNRKIDDMIAIVLYQTENSLVHVKKKDGQFTIEDLPDN